MSYEPSKRSRMVSLSQKFTEIANEMEAQGKRVIRMHAGEPSDSPPKRALDFVTKIIQQKHCGYTGSTGIVELRNRIAKHYKEKYDVEVDPSQVIVTIGASTAFFGACLTAFERGEKIIVPYPSYPSYQMIFELMGIEVIGIPTYPENNMMPTVEDLEKVKEDARGLLLISPNNPSGAIISASELKKVADYCESRGIRLISDEIYHGVEYDPDVKADTALRYSEHAVVINSFSKYYSIAGWRLGWLVVPPNFAEPIANLLRNLYICPTTPSQYLALAVLDCKNELEQSLQRYATNRDIMLREMPKAGFDQFVSPQGAFYFYTHVAELEKDSAVFCERMLRETGISSLPGSKYDPLNGKHYVRFSYAGSTEEIEEAMEILKKWRHENWPQLE